MHANNMTARASVLERGGDFRGAEALFRAVVDLGSVGWSADYNLGNLLRRLGRPREAEPYLRQALVSVPTDARVRTSLGHVLLAQGKLVEGFSHLEARHEIAAANTGKPPFPFPEWRGEDLAGKKLLIWPDQGFGDQIQFARFAPVLMGMGADVTLLCRPELHTLFESDLGVRVIAARGAVEFPDPDFWVMSGDLAGRLGATLETLPTRPYLAVPGAPAIRGGRLKVGIATRGNPAHANDKFRSLPSGAAGVLRGLPVEITSLHPEDTGARDFAATAALLRDVDLVISVDTSIAHLAGAMGKPCWIMLPSIGTDWRWMVERSDSPWYPTARLFRQISPGDWTEVLSAIASEIGRLGA